MKRMTAIPLAALALACSSVESRPSCGSSADCPVGQYCASTSDGNVCWADGAAPVVSAVGVTCDTSPCRRDGVLHVSATITDDHEVLDAGASVDLGAAAPVAMVRSGGSWSADVPLRELPFEAFSRAVVATVTARDGARNVSTPVSGAPVNVTRLLWERVIDATVGFRPTVPAVMPDGTAVLGGSTGQIYFIASDGTDAHPPLPVATGQISAAPAIGERAIWVGSEDFSLYGITLDTKELLANVGVNTDGPVHGSVGLNPEASKEWGFASSDAGRIAAASTVGLEYSKSPMTNPFTTGPVVRSDGKVCAVSATVVATLRCYTFDGAFAEDWNQAVGSSVSAPLAIDAAGSVWTGSQDGKLNRTNSGGSTASLATLSRPISDSPVICSNGDVVLGDGGGTLYRITSTGAVLWSRKLNGDPLVDDALLAPLILSGGPETFLVSTKTGTVYALDSEGNEVWMYAIASGTELRAGNIYTPPSQPAGTPISIAYFSATNGKLYAVLVDGELDASAPWPKAFHDPRNTNRAGPQP